MQILWELHQQKRHATVATTSYPCPSHCIDLQLTWPYYFGFFFFNFFNFFSSLFFFFFGFFFLCYLRINCWSRARKSSPRNMYVCGTLFGGPNLLLDFCRCIQVCLPLFKSRYFENAPCLPLCVPYCSLLFLLCHFQFCVFCFFFSISFRVWHVFFLFFLLFPLCVLLALYLSILHAFSSLFCEVSTNLVSF